jgi:soluble lytic murein transglycosylase
LILKMFAGAAFLLVLGPADAQPDPAASAPPQIQTPQVGYRAPLSEQDQAAVRQALQAALSGDAERARALQSGLSDPVARKLVLWAMVDQAGERLSFFELDQARKDLWGWPRAARRQSAAEKQLENQGLSPKSVIDWFKGQQPATAEGAMALAAALRASGQADDAARLIRRFWREEVFEAEPQRQMLARFGDVLTQDDHIHRTDMLLYGQQGPASRDMIALLPPDQQDLARARIALRSGAGGDLIVERLPPNLQDDPGLAYERARTLARQKRADLALSLVRRLPSKPPGAEAADAVWDVRRRLVVAALNARDYRTAYQAAAEHGLPPGVDYAEAEFYAGWLALTKLNKAEVAEVHFAHIQQVGSSPITQSRALYWRARALDGMGDLIGARDFYAQASNYFTTFYGQLAAQRMDQKELDIGRDPAPTPADRARFEGRELVQAAKMLYDAGQQGLFKSFMLNIAETLPKAEEAALLVDLAKSYGDQDLSMRVARNAAQRGFILPERAYPVMGRSSIVGDAEPALVLSIARQESNFDPGAKSAPGARGMMQLMPGTAKVVARRMGEPYSVQRLFDPEYNVRLGSYYLGSMVDDFGGSYVMATASYNAGPNHMPEWTSVCGDPRTSSGDPIDFIECIPFSETRNYVMRVMESAQVYRARLNGGKAPLTLAGDLKRGNYAPVNAPSIAANEPASSVAAATGRQPGTMAPIPD